MESWMLWPELGGSISEAKISGLDYEVWESSNIQVLKFPTQTPTQNSKIWFPAFSSQEIGSRLVSLEMIFEALQSKLFRLNFQSLSSKILKIPEFNLAMNLLSTEGRKGSRRISEFHWKWNTALFGGILSPPSGAKTKVIHGGNTWTRTWLSDENWSESTNELWLRLEKTFCLMKREGN